MFKTLECRLNDSGMKQCLSKYEQYFLWADLVFTDGVLHLQTEGHLLILVNLEYVPCLAKEGIAIPEKILFSPLRKSVFFESLQGVLQWFNRCCTESSKMKL